MQAVLFWLSSWSPLLEQLGSMALMATFAALAILLLRLLLRRMPKRYSYILWGAVGFRLVMPVSFSLPISLAGLWKQLAEALPATAEQEAGAVREAVTGTLERSTASLPSLYEATEPAWNPGTIVQSAPDLRDWLPAALWLAGVLGLLIYGTVSYVRMQRRLRTATLLQCPEIQTVQRRLRMRRKLRVFEWEQADTPFVCGFFRPRVILPTDLNEKQREVVLTHELVHIARLDYWIKPAAFVLLSVYWFHPLLWVCFWLFSRDLEMSCDERAVEVLGEQTRADYSASLVAMAQRPRLLLRGSPLAFGETGIVGRVKNILRFRKPALWVTIAAVLLLIAAVVFLIANPPSDTSLSGTQALAQVSFTQAEQEDGTVWLDAEQEQQIRQLLDAPAWEAAADSDRAGTSQSIRLHNPQAGLYGDAVEIWKAEDGSTRLCLSLEDSGEARSCFRTSGSVYDNIAAYLAEIAAPWEPAGSEEEAEPVVTPISGLVWEETWHQGIEEDSYHFRLTPEESAQIEAVMQADQWVEIPESEWDNADTGTMFGDALGNRLQMTGGTRFTLIRSDGTKTVYQGADVVYSRVTDTIYWLPGYAPFAGMSISQVRWNGVDYDMTLELGAVYWSCASMGEIEGGYSGDAIRREPDMLLTLQPSGQAALYADVEGQLLFRINRASEYTDPLSWMDTEDYFADMSELDGMVRKLEGIDYGDREADTLLGTLPLVRDLNGGYIKRIEVYRSGVPGETDWNFTISEGADTDLIWNLMEAIRSYPRQEQVENLSSSERPELELMIIPKDGSLLGFYLYRDAVRVMFSSPDGSNMYDTFFYRLDETSDDRIMELLEGAFAGSGF